MIDVEAIRKLCEANSPHVSEALRNCVRFYVSHWYVKSDGTEATLNELSPVAGLLDALDAARTLVPQLLEAYERMRALLVDAVAAFDDWPECPDKNQHTNAILAIEQELWTPSEETLQPFRDALASATERGE